MEHIMDMFNNKLFFNFIFKYKSKIKNKLNN
uniref:Uncharacterized protein n=1 Tax=viral metagenome TaxID=1070528 RepID=A0A6C0AMP5_9ZZZZ